MVSTSELLRANECDDQVHEQTHRDDELEDVGKPHLLLLDPVEPDDQRGRKGEEPDD
jgi:hypothetical protein